MSSKRKSASGGSESTRSVSHARKFSRFDRQAKGRKIKLDKQKPYSHHFKYRPRPFAQAKRERRDANKREREATGAAKPQVRTIENTREVDPTSVDDDDAEVQYEDEHDEFAPYFSGKTEPKVLVTLAPKAKLASWKLGYEFRKCIPNCDLLNRRNVPVSKVISQAAQRGYTDVMIINEDNKTPNGLMLCHLPDGPTAYFKINSYKFTKDIKKTGPSSSHPPEVIVNNFGTRLGHTIGRMLASLFPQRPDFKGRRLVTFHNQRDYIFFRHHRYEFKREGEKAALLELGPRLTLRLKWLQAGVYDSKGGQYEWILKLPNFVASHRLLLIQLSYIEFHRRASIMTAFWRNARDRTREMIYEAMGSAERTQYNSATQLALQRHATVSSQLAQLQSCLAAVSQPDPVEWARASAMSRLQVADRTPRQTRDEKLAAVLAGTLVMFPEADYELRDTLKNTCSAYRVKGRSCGTKVTAMEERCLMPLRRYKQEHLDRMERSKLERCRLDLDAQRHKKTPDQFLLQQAQTAFNHQENVVCDTWTEAERAAVVSLDKLRLFVKADLDHHRRCVAALEALKL